MLTRKEEIRATISRQSLRAVAIKRALRNGQAYGPCRLCGELIFKHHKHPDPRSASIDHKIPLARGGTNAISNLQLAHLGCNSRKQDRLPGELSLAQALRRRSLA